MSIKVQNVKLQNPVFLGARAGNSVSNPVLTGGNEHKQINCLIDTNHNSLLVKRNNISFTGGINSANGLGKVVVHDFGQRIASAVSYLKTDELLLVGKNLESAKSGLLESIASVPHVIKKLLFIEEQDLETAFAIKRNNFGSPELLNLDKEELVMLSRGKSYSVSQGDNILLEGGDTAYAKGANFYYPEEPDQNVAQSRADFIKVFDFAKNDNVTIQRLNAKNVQQVTPRGVKSRKKVTFADIGGQDKAIAQIKKELIYPIKYPNFHKNSQAAKSILFVGPPGNGKTQAARAIAGELNVPFFDMNGQLLEDKMVGNSAKQIHAYYEQAKQNQPCVIFYDEIDAVLGKRSGDASHRYADQSVSLHLDEISKLEAEGADVYLIGATNNPEIMDGAAKRSGRFGTKIIFTNPDFEGCKEVFGIHSKGYVLENFDLDAYAKKLQEADVSGADIKDIIAKAEINAKERLGIYKQMEEGTFVDSPNFEHIISGEDLDKSLTDFVDNRTAVEKYSEKVRKDRKEQYKTDMLARQDAEEELFVNNRKKKSGGMGFQAQHKE